MVPLHMHIRDAFLLEVQALADIKNPGHKHVRLRNIQQLRLAPLQQLGVNFRVELLQADVVDHVFQNLLLLLIVSRLSAFGVRALGQLPLVHNLNDLVADLSAVFPAVREHSAVLALPLRMIIILRF